MTQRPNIVLILADDMGYGDLGCFGNPDVRTPCLDALAGEGTRLTQHYSGSPVCAPARAALMTGRYPHRTGAIDTLDVRGLDRLSTKETTLADVLRRSGYGTGLFGKWHLGALDPRYHPNARGFDEFVGFRGGWSDYWQWRLDRNGSFSRADGRYLTDVITEEAVGFVQRHHREPFFLHVAYNAPHFPLQAPDEDVAPFRETGRFTEAVSLIYGMNARMDAGVGRILEELDRLGIAENTIVLFTSDNGPQFGGQGDMCSTRFNASFNGAKGVVYEGGIRVPAILRWPGRLEAGASIHEMISFIDWLPTLAEAAGARLIGGQPIDGRSALSVLQGEPAADQPPRFWQWNRYSPVKSCNAAVRDGRWKLIRPVIHEAMTLEAEDIQLDRKSRYDPDSVADIRRDPWPERAIPAAGPELLFDVQEDPFELNDLAQRHRDVRQRLSAALDDWFDEVEAERNAIRDTLERGQ